MQEKIVRRMHDVFGAGLELKERLERGENPRFEAEHGKLLALLLAGGELDYDAAYNGDYATGAGRVTSTSDNMGNRFFGVRYALTCWIDEIFVSDSPSWWSNQWVADTMEVRLYGGTQQRAWRFWDQARKAEGPRGSTEALESYMWAVMLGFRGDPPGDLHPPTWVENIRKRLLSTRSTEFPVPAQREAPMYAPALRGPDRMKTMFRVATVVGALAAFTIAYAGVAYFGK
jgi:type VI protein secretion system component VasF